MESKRPKLIAVVGPTGSGKTKLAVALAQRFNGVIISADSRQVYRGLDVGTNKEGEIGRWQNQPARIIDGVPQLLIDIAAPGERYTLNDWLKAARSACQKIWAQPQLPIVVGGTGLYVTALTEGYQPGKGRHSQARQSVEFESLILMPDIDRQELYQKSDQRYPRIFDRLIQETRGLLASGVSSDWLISLGLDYRWATLFILGRRNRELAIEEFQQASRHYIRRQQTWWRHHGSVTPVPSADQAQSQVEEFIK